MQQIIKTTKLILACAIISGCVTSPNLLFLKRPGIDAQGGISRKREQIDVITITPQQLPDQDRHDLWVEISPDNRLPLADITEDIIKKASVKSYITTNTGTTSCSYYIAGYSFEFEAGHFTRLDAIRYSFPPPNIPVHVEFGSQKRNCKLSLPCSIADFENVFGASNTVTRGFFW